MKNLLFAIAFAALFALASTTAPGAAEPPPGKAPVVVEMFTSQGCSSCPPADAYLSELAADPGVLALSMHVDYWNGLGWEDPFSSPAITRRQRDYARALAARFVYTPQAVVMGRAQAVGSNRADVARLIARARAEMPPPPALEIRHAPPARLVIGIGEKPFVGRATVWLVAYDGRHSTKVAAGENGGRTLVYSNVVRALRPVGSWSGRAAELSVDVAEDLREGFEYCAVLLQAEGTGAIVAAARLAMGPAAR